MVLLRLNDNGPRVVELQNLLNQRINAGLPLTGIFGPLTHRAVIQFQTSVGLNPDGIVGSDTWAALTNTKPIKVEDRVRTFYIIAGHDLVRDPGAVNNNLGLTEAREAVWMRDAIANQMRNSGAVVIIDNDNWNLQQTINDLFARVKPWDVILDIHFNAATPAAVGTEAFVSDPCTNEENTIAHNICVITNRVLGVPIRANFTPALLPGVKYETATRHKRLGILRPNCQNVLWEICFISNDNEMRVYQQRRSELANQVANYLLTLIGN